jgi:hypothetical protein
MVQLARAVDKAGDAVALALADQRADLVGGVVLGAQGDRGTAEVRSATRLS